MNDLTNVTWTFLDLIRRKKIRIPKIQRDYAEGRDSNHVREIRRAFLNALLRTLCSSNAEPMHLDFVYGYDRADAFEPLDGQQRLTTLFLLHWLFSPTGCSDLLDESGRSRFTYETRISAEEFCDEIVKHDARQLFGESVASGKTMKNLVLQRDWFKWSWRKDPSVASMLVVIDDALSIIEENGYVYDASCYSRLSLITFNFLDLSEFRQGDELYVKMNARGKQLSSFDVLKSTLEEEIRLQHQDRNLSVGDGVVGNFDALQEKEWRRKVDGEWIDYFWFKRRKLPDGTVSVYDVEDKYKRLMLRLVSLQFMRQEKCLELKRLANSGDECDLENFIVRYVATAWKARSTGSDICPFIDFNLLMNDVDALIGRKSDSNGKTIWFDFTDELDAQYTWGSNSSTNILDLYLGDSFTYPVRLGFYGLLSFLRRFPIRTLVYQEDQGTKKNIIRDDRRLDDLRTWGRFLRNCTIIENCNDRFDTSEKVIAAMNLIDKWVSDYAASGMSMREFIANIGDESSFERARLSEESLKANLRADDEWLLLINDSETDGYLRGQIGCLLNWSKTDDQISKTRFREYSNRLLKITGLFLAKKDQERRLQKFYAAMLALGDYRFGKHKTLGIVPPAERFYSWKRYLREEIGGCYAPGVKRFIDYWHQNHPGINDLIDYCEVVISEFKPQLKDWRAVMVSCPALFSQEYAEWGVVAEREGHFYLARGKTENSRSYEVLISYLYEHAPSADRMIYDSIQPTNVANSVEYSAGGNKYRLQIAANGTYALTINGQEQKGLCVDDVVEKLGFQL